MDVTLDLLQKIFPSTPAKVLTTFVGPLNDTLGKYEINTVPRLAMFLAQCGHETGGFTRIEENLMYGGERLLVVYPKYFKNVNTSLYERNPEKIANHVYCNRMGNGPEESGDGYKFRGRGLIQTTGKYNYQLLATVWNMSLDEVVKFMGLPIGAVKSAAEFWRKQNLNAYADTKDVDGATKIINGGYKGLEERKALFSKVMSVLA